MKISVFFFEKKPDNLTITSLEDCDARLGGSYP